MINFVGRLFVIKKMHHVSLIVSLFFLLFFIGGCFCPSQSIVVANLDDTIKSFAYHAAKGAHESGAEIKDAELKVNAGTAFDIEAGTIFPVALPVTVKGKAQIQEGITLTLKLNLDNVQYEDNKLEQPKIRIYEMNAETHKIRKYITNK